MQMNDEYGPVSARVNDNDVTVELGDVTRTGADAIIVPQFDNCASYGGVGGAVARNGAVEGMQKYELYLQKNGEQKFGTVVLTTSGGGNSKYLLHAVSVGSGTEHEFNTAKLCMFNAMEIAEQNGVKSVAAPALGTGIIGRLTDRQSAEAMMSGIAEYKQKGGKNIPVSFVIFGDIDAYQAFANVLRSGSYSENGIYSQVGERELDVDRWRTEMNRDAIGNRKHFGSPEGPK